MKTWSTEDSEQRHGECDGWTWETFNLAAERCVMIAIISL